MPIGYLIFTGGMALAAVSAVLRHRPRRSSPFRLSYVFGLWLNWPLVALLVLGAATALAIDQTGIDAAGVRVGLGLACIAATGLSVLWWRSRRTGHVLQVALSDVFGGNRSSSARAHSFRRRAVRRIGGIRYGPAPRRNRLDLYRDRSGRTGRPALIYFHARMSSKRLGARYLLRRLARRGWVCVSADYRSPARGISESLSDVKRVIGWVREHAGEHGIDPDAVFLAGSSLGGFVAARAAFTPDTSVAGLITLYGYYGGLDYSTVDAPPCFVLHGDQDTLVPVEDARSFVEHLRATSANEVVYAELPGAQHGFDLFRSRRLDLVIGAIEEFAARILSSRPRDIEPNKVRKPISSP